ncbi:DUF4190 domain-containing protein [Cellulomonas sp. NPDC055163]
MTTPGDPTPQDPSTAPEDGPAPAGDPGATSDGGQPTIDLTKPREAAAQPTGSAPSSVPGPAEPAPGQPYAPAQPRTGVEPSAGQPQPGQQHPAQPYPAQPYAGQPYPAQPYPAQPYPAQPYPGQPYPGQPYAPAYVYPKNQLGVWSLVLGIVGIVVGCVFVTGIPAVILGNNAKRAVAAGEANNLGTAQAGIVLGWISIALGVVAIGFVVLYLVGMAGVLGLTFLSTGSSSY